MPALIRKGDEAHISAWASGLTEISPEYKSRWGKILREILARHHILSAAISFHRGTLEQPDATSASPGMAQPDAVTPVAGSASAFELASVDVFVEKAQHLLRGRANWYYIYAALAVLATVVVLGLAIWFLAFRSTPEVEIALLAPLAAENSFKITVFVIKAVALSGLVLGLIYFMASLARAFLHEGTIIDNRIHSLRFGRLYIYLKYGSAGSVALETLRTSLNVKDLEQAFAWNIETSTAFKDIKSELLARNTLVAALDSIAEIAKEVRQIPLIQQQAATGDKKPDTQKP